LEQPFSWVVRLLAVHNRELRAAERRVKDAKSPMVKTLDTFDFQAQPSINQELIRGEYMDRCETCS